MVLRAGEYAPTEDACTSAGTSARATASNTRMLPSTLLRQVVAGSCVGWNAQARWTTASAPANSWTRSNRSEARSTADHSVFGGDQSGIRRARPRTEPTSGSSARARTTLVPTLPVAPVTTTLMPAALLTFRSLRPERSAEAPGTREGEWKAPAVTGNHGRGGQRWVRMAVASRRRAPQGFSRTIVPVGEW